MSKYELAALLILFILKVGDSVSTLPRAHVNHATRAYSRAMTLSFAFIVFLTLTEFAPGNSTLLSCLSIPASSPATIHSVNVYLVEMPGVAPGSSSVVKSLQHYNTIYTTDVDPCQVFYLGST